MADEMINSYVALDLETTGIGARHEKITEIGMVKVIDGETTDTYHTMVNPHREIPKRIVELTGITDDMVKDALGIEEILDEVLAFTEDLPLLGHQIIFDYGFLVQAAVNQKMEFECEAVDTLKVCRKLMPEQEKKNLGNACTYYKIEQPLAHRAEADALSAHFLYQKLVALHGEEQPELFVTTPLNCRMKRQQPATKRQKEYLQDLLKCHRIDITVQLDDISRSDASRLIDKIILQYGRVKPQNK